MTIYTPYFYVIQEVKTAVYITLVLDLLKIAVQ
jgi:hypothetical protein